MPSNSLRNSPALFLKFARPNFKINTTSSLQTLGIKTHMPTVIDTLSNEFRTTMSCNCAGFTILINSKTIVQCNCQITIAEPKLKSQNSPQDRCETRWCKSQIDCPIHCRMNLKTFVSFCICYMNCRLFRTIVFICYPSPLSKLDSEICLSVSVYVL